MHERARQGIARAAAAAATLFAATAFAQQPFPAKPVRIVAGTTAGSQPDGLSRIIGQKLSEAWAKPVVIENRPGGGGSLAGATVAKATPDGHTLMYALPAFSIAAAMQAPLPYDPLKDFVGVSQIGFSTNVLVVTPSLNAKSVKDFIAIAKAQPGKLIFGSGATGTAGHLSGARFNLIAGIKVVHVAFRGGPEAAIEVLAGRSHYTVSTLGVALPFITDRKLVALAVLSPQRSPVLPDVPALSEIMPEFKRPESSHSILAPAGTTRAIVNQLNKAVLRVLDSADVKERFQAISFVMSPSTPEECDRILRTQIETLSQVVRDAGLRTK